MDRRISEERRKQPTPAVSQFTFFGRRRNIRREGDRRKTPYVDRYSSSTFFFLVLILALNILDSLFTMMILDVKGREVNPIVRSVMDLYGSNFWVWKFGIVSLCTILLCMHSKVKAVKGIIIVLSSIYLTVVLYQILILSRL